MRGGPRARRQVKEKVQLFFADEIPLVAVLAAVGNPVCALFERASEHGIMWVLVVNSVSIIFIFHAISIVQALGQILSNPKKVKKSFFKKLVDFFF